MSGCELVYFVTWWSYRVEDYMMLSNIYIASLQHLFLFIFFLCNPSCNSISFNSTITIWKEWIYLSVLYSPTKEWSREILTGLSIKVRNPILEAVVDVLTHQIKWPILESIAQIILILKYILLLEWQLENH